MLVEYFSPLRPRINHLPAYVDAQARRIAPMPDICLAPLPTPGLWEARLMLRAAGRGRGFTWFYTLNLTPAAVLKLMENFQSDPEWTMAYWFGYDGPGEPQAPARLSRVTGGSLGVAPDPEEIGI